MLFGSLGGKVLRPEECPLLVGSLVAGDASEGMVCEAGRFLEGVYGHGEGVGMGYASRAPTPMTVSSSNNFIRCKPPVGLVEKMGKDSGGGGGGGLREQWSLLGMRSPSPDGERNHAPTMSKTECQKQPNRRLEFWRSPRFMKQGTKHQPQPQDISFVPRRIPLHRPSTLPTLPDVSAVRVASTDDMDYTVLVSMYEVYNDRIFDLLSHPRNSKDNRRRPLLFKYTEGSSDRKLVAGLKKVVCGSYEEALMVLETGLAERSVAGTGSNSVSSRSHGFFCLEVKKRRQGGMCTAWSGSQLTIVDLAGTSILSLR